MVHRETFENRDERFRQKLKQLVAKTLPVVFVSGTLMLTHCSSGPATKEGTQTEQTKEKVTEQAKEKTTEPITEYPVVVDGRRPDGLCEPAFDDSYMTEERDIVSAFFARIVHLERSAVVAFEYLARELEAYNAPQELIDIAYQAVEEEKEHARLMTQVVEHFGGASIPPVEVAPFKLRPLYEIAFENAEEGCTRETYGALMALWQAEAANDELVRSVCAQVGHDESRHAALSWAIDEWVTPLLTIEQQQELMAIKASTMDILREESRRPVHPALVKWAGYPTPQAASLLLQDSFAA